MTERNEFDPETANAIFGNPGEMMDDPRFAQLATLAFAMPAGLLGSRATASGNVKFHAGSDILIPEGTTYEELLRIFRHRKEQDEKETTWDEQFEHRPEDGVFAAMTVLRRRYGTADSSSSLSFGMFGPSERPAEERMIQISSTERIPVPWGQISIPKLKGLTFVFCDYHRHPIFGKVFEIHASGPNRYASEVKEIFAEIREELRTNSIYKGKAMSGTTEMTFIDVNTVNPDEHVFARLVTRELSAKVWRILKSPELVLAEGVSPKRAVLFQGGNGGGKTSAAIISAQIAIKHGWTVFFAKTGDDINDVLLNARRYERSMVVYEDADRQGTLDDDSLARLLDTFDGAAAKGGGQLMVLLTTNREKKIPKGMLRPGRLDACIKFGELDDDGIVRLLRAIIPAHKLGDIDDAAVAKANKGFMPAFVREVGVTARLFALDAHDGNPDYVISTEDLVDAAASLREQHEAHLAANDHAGRPRVDEALLDLVDRTVMARLNGATFERSSDGGSVMVLKGAELADEG